MVRVLRIEGVTRRFALLAAGVCAVMVVNIGITAKPAAAITYYYSVDPIAACSYNYGGGSFAASFYWWSPDALYCYGLGIPFAVSYVGPLDRDRISRYCRWKYGYRAYAVVEQGWWFPTIAWDCVISR